MNNIIIALLVISALTNLYLAYRRISKDNGDKLEEVKTSAANIIKELTAKLSDSEDEVTRLNSVITVQETEITRLTAKVERLTKAAGFAGKVSGGIQAIGNALKKATVPNAGTAIGKMAGTIVNDTKAVGRSFKDAAANVKSGYEAKTGG